MPRLIDALILAILLVIAFMLWSTRPVGAELVSAQCLSEGQSAIATYYHPSLSGDTMANGQPYNPWALTAASNDFPLGARLLVTYCTSTIVEVTDRGAFPSGQLDLSQLAFYQLVRSYSPGVIPVTIAVIEEVSHDR